MPPCGHAITAMDFSAAFIRVPQLSSIFSIISDVASLPMLLPDVVMLSAPFFNGIILLYEIRSPNVHADPAGYRVNL